MIVLSYLCEISHTFMNHLLYDTVNSNCQTCNDKSCAAQSLSISELIELGDSCYEASFSKGDMILAEGSITSHVIYLREGLVKEFGKKDLTEEYILQVVKPHSYLGLHSILSDTFNHYSYTALTNVKVCFINLELFVRLIKSNGQFGYEILSSVCNDSLNNYHRFIKQHQKKIFGKVADALLYFSQVIFNKSSFELPLSRKEIAYMIGTSRESISKQLTDFEKEGILQVNGRHISILNMEKLKGISRVG